MTNNNIVPKYRFTPSHPFDLQVTIVTVGAQGQNNDHFKKYQEQSNRLTAADGFFLSEVLI